MKKEARNLRDITYGLCRMSDKQRRAVVHLLPSSILDAVSVAVKLPRTNQGRKRQEGLIVKLLRTTVAEGALDTLSEAVRVADNSDGIYEDHAVQDLIDEWRTALVDNDQEIVQRIYDYPLAWAPDHQQLRQLVRQCQQALSSEAKAAAAASTNTSSSSDSLGSPAAALPSSSSSSSSSSSDPWLTESPNNSSPATSTALSSSTGTSSSSFSSGSIRGDQAQSEDDTPEWKPRPARKGPPRSQALLRSLGQLLKPLAVRVAREAEAEAAML